MQQRLRRMRGTGPRTTGAGGAFFSRRAGACPPQSLPHPGHPDSDVIDIKVRWTFFFLFLLHL